MNPSMAHSLGTTLSGRRVSEAMEASLLPSAFCRAARANRKLRGHPATAPPSRTERSASDAHRRAGTHALFPGQENVHGFTQVRQRCTLLGRFSHTDAERATQPEFDFLGRNA